MSRTQTYQARWVLPIDGEPLEYGEVVVEDGVIQAARPAQGPGDDLGDAVLMPGFVNAHTHLEYTALRGFLEDVPFFPWIRALTAAKAQFGTEDWLWSARLGALESLAGGVTTLGDNTDAGVTMQTADECGLRGIIYQEVFGPDPRDPVEPILAALQAKIAAHRRRASARVGVGVSPHALYTVRPALMAALNEYVARERLPTSLHLAESHAESELIAAGAGPFAEMYMRRGIAWETPGTTPTRYADALGALGPGALAIHCVRQTADDIACLAASGAAIIHCPKSNGKLAAGVAPLAAWLRTPGLRVGLGTDSAVSNNALDFFEEMRHAVLTQRAVTGEIEAVTARQILRAATLGGAEAMGLDAVTGSLTPGKRADLIAVGLEGVHAVPATDPYAALVYAARASDVRLTVCDGQVLYRDGVWTTLDRAEIVRQARAIRGRAAG